MTERPILFSGAMVRAILEGRKTQTRRVVRGVDECPHGYDGVVTATVPKEAHLRGMHCFALASGVSLYLRCPYGAPGDRLWVRENGWQRPERTPRMMREGADTWPRYEYDADITQADHEQLKEWGWKRRPSIHMPRAACRLILEVTSVRVERLQDISEADAIAEGCSAEDQIENALVDPMNGRANVVWAERAGSAKEAFCNLWQRIHKRPHDEPTAWEENPWVWVVSFRRAAAEKAAA